MRTSSARRCASMTIVLLLIAVGAPGARAAEPPGSAPQLLRKAKELYAAGSLGEARALLIRARAAAGAEPLRVEIWFHLGLALAAENESEAARTAFRSALRYDPGLSIDPEQYKPSLVQLFEEARRSLQGELRVACRGGGAGQKVEVWIDGVKEGKAPLKRRLLAGGHRVEIRSPRGDRLASRAVRIEQGRLARAEFVLPPAAGSAKPVVRAPSEKELAPPRRQRRARGRFWTWIAAGTAVVAAGVAAGLGLSAIDDRDEGCWILADPELPCEQRSHLQREESRAEYLELQRSVDRKRIGANVALGTAAALAAAAVVLFWLEGRAVSRERTSASRLRIGKGSIGVSIGY